MQYTRENVVEALRRTGFAELAEEAARVLPDPVDLDEVQKWSASHGITLGDLINRMGGSP